MKEPWNPMWLKYIEMKYYLILPLLLTFFSAFAQKGLILDKVVANVGSEYVLYSEVQELFGYALAQNPTFEQDFQCVILEQIISKKLLLDQARLDSIVISDIELDVELQRRMDYILSRMERGEDQFYEFYGRTVLQERERMREPLREEMIQQRIQGQLIQNVSITPEETIKFFDRIPKDSLPFRSAEVEIAEISMKTIISKAEKQKALDKLENIRKRIVDDGESFEELASLYSDDPGSGSLGGDLGWAKRGTYVPEFEAAAYSLEPGEYSDIIETQFGYHLIQMIQRRGNNINVRHILIRPEETPEDIAYSKSVLDSVVNLIRLDSLSFDLAVKLYSDKEAQSFNNAGRLINNQTGDTFWETKQLPYQIYFAIESIEVGDITDILEFEERGEKTFKVILLQSKTRPHVASLKSDFSWIQQYAKESKKNEYFNNWMEEKIASTYIEIIPQFRSCPNLQQYLIYRDSK